MNHRIITISQEFGSGGRTIGKMAAEKLGIPYYDKDLVKKVAVETGFDESYIEKQGEDAPSNSIFGYAFAARGMNGAMNGMSADDFLWVIQRNVILDLSLIHIYPVSVKFIFTPLSFIPASNEPGAMPA